MEQTCIQYTPPDIHCTNSAKHAIQTWKNHFLAGMAGLPTSFPIASWCCLTTQCNATLNMLRPCCQNFLLLAHKALKGLFSFDATPMASLGTEVLVNMKPYQTKSMMHVGLSCIQGVVHISCRKCSLLHSSLHGQHRRQEDHRHVLFQASCHPSPRNDCYQQNH